MQIECCGAPNEADINLGWLECGTWKALGSQWHSGMDNELDLVWRGLWDSEHLGRENREINVDIYLGVTQGTIRMTCVLI